MRIVSGKHRGRIITSPKNDLIRPTSDKVRLAIFNALNSRHAVVDAVALDVFCGTGALSLEALSQGAAQAVLIDADKVSLELAKRNAADLKETENCQFILKDAVKLTEKPDHQNPATLCFLDPPYRKNLIAPTIANLKASGWLAPGCWIVAEMEKDFSLVDFNIDAEKIYGETKILIGRI